ncbi:hypothetical protein Tco_1275595, partial [Tanacetum coccineum]
IKCENFVGGLIVCLLRTGGVWRVEENAGGPQDVCPHSCQRVTHSEAKCSVSSVIAITDVYLSVGSDMREAKPSARHSESKANAVYISYKVMFEHLRKNLKECGP